MIRCQTAEKAGGHLLCLYKMLIIHRYTVYIIGIQLMQPSYISLSLCSVGYQPMGPKNVQL